MRLHFIHYERFVDPTTFKGRVVNCDICRSPITIIDPRGKFTREHWDQHTR